MRRAYALAGSVWRWVPKGVAPLIALLVVSGAGAFLELADDVQEGDYRSFDSQVLLAFRTPGDLGTPLGPAWLRQSMIDVSALGGFTLVWAMTGLSFGLLVILRRWAAAAILAAGVGGISVLNAVLKLGFHRARPQVVPHLAEVSNASFPSGHATIAAATYLIIGALLAQTFQRRTPRVYVVAITVAITLAVGISRLYLGVHWPTDVMAGWALGSAWALVFWLIAHAVNRAAPKVGAGAEPAPTLDDQSSSEPRPEVIS